MAPHRSFQDISNWSTKKWLLCTIHPTAGSRCDKGLTWARECGSSRSYQSHTRFIFAWRSRIRIMLVISMAPCPFWTFGFAGLLVSYGRNSQPWVMHSNYIISRKEREIWTVNDPESLSDWVQSHTALVKNIIFHHKRVCQETARGECHAAKSQSTKWIQASDHQAYGSQAFFTERGASYAL